MGRPTKLTPELQEHVLTAIRAGAFIEAACEYAGIHPATYYRWMEQGENGEEPYGEFREAVMRERAGVVVRNAAIIAKAAQEGDWKASAWWMERSFPDQYGRRTNIAGANGGAVKIEATADEEREARLKALVQQALEDARNR